MKLQIFATSCMIGFLLLGSAWVLAAEPPVNAGESLNKSPRLIVVSAAKQIDTLPKLLQGAAPVYPIRQLHLTNSGQALIEFTITPQGDSRDFRVVSASYKSFADHAILAVEKWRWQPARKQGHPVPVRVRIPFNYVTRSYGNTGNQVPY